MVSLLREPTRPGVVRADPRAGWLAVGTVCFGAFMGQLDASIVTVAFPSIQRQFSAGLAQVQWISLAYLLTLIALLVPVGRLSDRFSRKLMYLYGFVLFSAASAACGLAPSLAILIVLRIVQATGAAMLQANSVALVTTSVPPRSRRKALGVQAAAQALGLAIGPLAGGLLVDAWGWRWIFFLNIPVGLVALVAGWFLLPGRRGPATSRRADPVGIIMLAATAATAMLVVSSFSGLRLPAWCLAACIVLAPAAGMTLWRWERRHPAPLINFPALAAAGITPALGGALAAYLVLFGPLVLLPQTLAGHGRGASAAGLLLTALPAGFGFAAIAGERLLPRRWSNRRRCVGGGILAAGSVAAMAIPAPYAVTVVLLTLLGVGLGVYTPANNAQIMTAVPGETAATGGGLVNMARGIGTALGVAVVTLALHAGTFIGLPAIGPRLAVAALAVAALAAAWAGYRADSGRRTSHE